MYKYCHGGNAVYESGRENIIDFSANINPLGMSDEVRDAIIREIPNCIYYPDNDSRLLRERIADFENVVSDMIFCGNGASDVIFRLPRATKAKSVMVTAPTFSDYERSAASCGAEIIRYPLSVGGGFKLDSGLCGAIRKTAPDLVFICHPNNPTGSLVQCELIEMLLDCCTDTNTWLVIDECFLDFVENSSVHTSKSGLGSYTKLVILKAFTKLFALPGIRLGYAMCSDMELIDRLRFHGADWPVSTLAQAAGIAALDDDAEGFISKTVRYVAQERAIIEYELARLGYVVFKSEANFVFICNPYSFDLGKELDKVGIRIRSCSNYHGLDEQYYRIAISTQENRSKLIAAIADITTIMKKG